MDQSASRAEHDEPTGASIADDAHLANAWRALLRSARPEIPPLLARVAERSLPDMADHFYGGMMSDPRSRRFLLVDTVRDRLKSSMQKWLRQGLMTTAGVVDS